MNFHFNEEEQEILDMLHDYAVKEVAPRAHEIDEEEKFTRVVVPDFQLSLAIGKEGQNARLAARLTGWKIDIKSESQMADLEENEGSEDAGSYFGEEELADEYQDVPEMEK